MKLSQLDPDRLPDEALKLSRFFSERMVGQEKAIKRIVNAYSYALSPIRPARVPAFAGLFLGPSGSGKTHAAEVLAEYFTDDPEGLTKIECANYFSEHMLSEIIGAPPGYVGHNNTPLLDQSKIGRPCLDKYAREIRKLNPGLANNLRKIDKMEKEIKEMSKTNDPRVNDLKSKQRHLANEYRAICANYLGRYRTWSVILFDELDKAHLNLVTFLLEIISKGRVTLANGLITKFYDSFIIMTSNYGSREIANAIRGKQVGFSATTISRNAGYQAAMRILKEQVPAEFLGRIRKNIVVFEELDQNQLMEVLEINLDQLQKRLYQTFPIRLRILEDVKEHLIQNTLEHPEYGARPLTEQIRHDIEEPLSKIVSSEQVNKNDTVYVVMGDGEIIFIRDSSSENEYQQYITGSGSFEDEDSGFQIYNPDEDRQ